MVDTGVLKAGNREQRTGNREQRTGKKRRSHWTSTDMLAPALRDGGTRGGMIPRVSPWAILDGSLRGPRGRLRFGSDQLPQPIHSPLPRRAVRANPSLERIQAF